MRLYSGTSKQFISDTIQNQIAEKLKQSFFSQYRFNPSPSEVNSWKNSLRAVKDVFEFSELMDHGVILEYQLPMTSKRMDCIICGKDSINKDNAVIIELKQWSTCEDSDSDNEVVTFIGGEKREVLHPSVQVGQYKIYLENTHTAFYSNDNAISLNACSYLHNYQFNPHDVIFADKFKSKIDKYPIFLENDIYKFRDFLSIKLEKGQGIETLKRIEKSEFRPSKKLLDHVANVVKSKPEYVLIDEQLIVFDKVCKCAYQGFHDGRKTVLIIKGGPGTGKSVIAMNLIGKLTSMGYNTQYATGSKAFTETIKKIVGPEAAILFKYTNSYQFAQFNEVDILIIDEAHRIRDVTFDRYRPHLKSGKKQVEELLNAAKVCVFFIDDNQIVRPDEIGSKEYIRQYSQKHNCKLYEYQLEAQFRCSGSDAFINWINNTLGIQKTANILWTSDDNFDFKIFNSPLELENAIRDKIREGNTGRVTAGFCWPWSKPDSNGFLINDIKISDYERPWNAKSNAGRLAKGIPKENYWAYDPNGISQIGCIYTAQGFEFDYVGVIFGKDLCYDMDAQEWVGYKQNSCDEVVKKSKVQFTDLIKNTYRVLLSRGMKGCYVYFMDKDTERFFRSRIEK